MQYQLPSLFFIPAWNLASSLKDKPIHCFSLWLRIPKQTPFFCFKTDASSSVTPKTVSSRVLVSLRAEMVDPSGLMNSQAFQ